MQPVNPVQVTILHAIKYGEYIKNPDQQSMFIVLVSFIYVVEIIHKNLKLYY
jgi:hypothetical protein